MSDNQFDNSQNPMGAGPDGADGPQVGVLAQYVKDLSFENPNAPMSLQAQSDQQKAPGIDVNVNVGARKANEDVYEVELKISATATQADGKTAFVVELVYGSLYGIRGLDEESLQGFMLVQAPTLMFPYARRIISDATRDGGFPPLLLEPISFEALYRQQLAQAQAQAEGSQPESDDPKPINLN